MRTLRSTLAYRTFDICRKLAQAMRLTKPLRRTIGPLAGRIVSRVSANHERAVMINDHWMVLGTRDSYPPIGMATGRFEPETTRLFGRLLSPGMVVVDAGAHVGYYSLIAARQVGPSGRVYAFEPDPTNYALLLQNIALNGYKNVVATNKALSNSTGSATLFLTELDSGRHSIYSGELPSKRTLEISTTTVDAFLGDQGWPRIDLVKIDVEGAEMEVLEGMNQLLNRPSGLNLIVEFNPALLQQAGVNPKEFLQNSPALLSGSLRFDSYWIDEGSGPLNVNERAATQLAERLLETGGSANLHYTRK